MRMLITWCELIIGRATSYDEAHQAILRRRQKNSYGATCAVVDTWSEPGKIENVGGDDDDDDGGITWQKWIPA